MRLFLRFTIPLLIALGLCSYAMTPFFESLAQRWFIRDIELRAGLIASSVHEALEEEIVKNTPREVNILFEKLVQDERLLALGFMDSSGKIIFNSAQFQSLFDFKADFGDQTTFQIYPHRQGEIHLAVIPFISNKTSRGHLVCIHDLKFVAGRKELARKYLFLGFLAFSLVAAFVTALVAQWSWRGFSKSIRSLITGKSLVGALSPDISPEVRPLISELKIMIRDMEKRHRELDEQQITWSPETLREILQKDFSDEEILVVSNREPYIHNWNSNRIEVRFPASGLVTAVEPIMRACSGMWIAHGSGTADREVVDRQDSLRVPPGNPTYRLKRVWLTEEEEAGYYYGFSNEGLWPLCHIAHVRPIFRHADWNAYYRVNQRFADTVLAEAKTNNPVIMIQDYHFALLPAMIRKQLPHATLLTTWHIPWPNSESFGICPWREEILSGLLGSTILGFHTQYHCNNFLECVDRYLETRIDREFGNVIRNGNLTVVNPYPISIEWPPSWIESQKSVEECQRRVRKRFSLPEGHLLGVGVDRMDYTKGIVEKMLAVENFLETNPNYVGRFSFLQVAAPSRSSIASYRAFQVELDSIVNRVNKKFGRDGYLPILHLPEHHEPDAVYELYRSCQFCFVNSLHDGMNLVAKEFIASRDDERGVLILSKFAGACKELSTALIVNPYDIRECAGAIQEALEMSDLVQRERMQLMRGLVRESNVYRWAGRMLLDAARHRKLERLSQRTGGKGL